MAEDEARPGRFDHCPWEFWSRSDDEERAAQLAHQEALAERLRADGGTAEFGDRVFVSPWAGVHTDSLRMGDRSYVGAHAIVTDEVSMGRNCTLNPFSTARGKVLMGDGVRVGAHTSLLGFNHGFAPGAPVHKQPLTSKGIVLGDDVWIGSHVVVVDGVTIGDHCVVGAGAVVTKDLAVGLVGGGGQPRTTVAGPAGHRAGPWPFLRPAMRLTVSTDGSKRSRGGPGSRRPGCWTAAVRRVCRPTGRGPRPRYAPAATPWRSRTCCLAARHPVRTVTRWWSGCGRSRTR